MGEECNYSFGDLFRAAHGRELDQEDAMKFVVVSQDDRNAIVKELAKQAGWGTKDKIGSDGKIYTAFHPEWKSHDS